jgi:hypothetical protein
MNIITADAVKYLKASVKYTGHVLTQELLDSIEYDVVKESSEIAVKATIQFNDYGRFKDMKVLRYNSLPPIDALREFVAKKGIDKFAYVPGYEFNKAAVPTQKAIDRIASAIVQHFKYVPTFKNTKQLGYNTVKINFINAAKRNILVKAQNMVLQGQKYAIENPS